jgi:GDP-4-dehydro-6-deoxy-D-mannose reductase
MPTSPGTARESADLVVPARILLTGADGFVGTHLRAALSRAFPAATLIAPGTDLRDATAIEAMVTAARPDRCIHLAAVSAVTTAAAEQDKAWAVNLGGSLALARALIAHAPGCRMIFASSAEAYGASFRAGIALDESAALAPQTIYGATKAAADLALGAMVRDGLDLVRLRLFNHTGPGQSDGFVVSAFARQLAAICLGLQPPVMQVGNLDSARDFLDVRDVCDAYVATLAAATLPAGLILNIASGVARRIGDVLDELREIAGVAVQVRTDPARLRPSDIPIACGNAGAARALLGWAPSIAWSRTLSDLLADWQVRLGAAQG